MFVVVIFLCYASFFCIVCVEICLLFFGLGFLLCYRQILVSFEYDVSIKVFSCYVLYVW